MLEIVRFAGAAELLIVNSFYMDIPFDITKSSSIKYSDRIGILACLENNRLHILSFDAPIHIASTISKIQSLDSDQYRCLLAGKKLMFSPDQRYLLIYGDKITYFDTNTWEMYRFMAANDSEIHLDYYQIRKILFK